MDKNIIDNKTIDITLDAVLKREQKKGGKKKKEKRGGGEIMNTEFVFRRA